MDHVINCFNSWRKGKILKCHVSEREKYLRALNSLKSLNTMSISYPLGRHISKENIIKILCSQIAFIFFSLHRFLVRQLLNLMISRELFYACNEVVLCTLQAHNLAKLMGFDAIQWRLWVEFLQIVLITVSLNE